MPSIYQAISNWFFSHKYALVILMVLCPMALVGFSLEGRSRPNWHAGVVSLLWWLVLVVVWFRPDIPDRQPEGRWAWVFSAGLDFFLVVVASFLFRGRS